MVRIRRRALLSIALGGMVAGACDSGGTQEPPPTPAITVAVGAATVQVLPGGNTTLPVTITRTGGYTGAVTLTAEAVPTAVTIAPVTIATGATTGMLAIAAGATATPATTTVTVRAAGTGVSAQTATFGLTVQEPPGFALTVNPATLSMQPGANGTATVNIARSGGFGGAVALTAAGAPAGMTVAFNPASATAATSTVTVTAGANTPVGNHTLTIQGNAPDMAQRTATLAVQVTAVPTIGITLNPTALAVTQGGSGAATVNLVRGGGFTGAVTVNIEGLPTGVTAAPATIAAGATSAAVTFTAAANATTGTGNVTVRALGTGVTDATATLALTVSQAAGYSLAAAPAAISVQQGASSTSTVSVTRVGGFNGAVALAASGQPVGMSVTFNPASVTGATSTVTVAAAAGVATGTYPVTIRGTAQGLAEQTTTLNVQVTAGSQTGGNVTFRFCPVSGIPVWVAAQNATGAWTRVTGNAASEYTFQVDTRGGVAYVISSGGNYETSVHYGTRAELQAMGSGLCEAGTGSTRNVSGTVSGVGALDMAYIMMGGGFAMVNSFTGTNFVLEGVAPGPVDLLASRMAVDMNAGTFAVNRFVLQRGLNPAAGSTISVDFAGANSFAPATGTMTLGNLGTDHAAVITMYSTAGGTLGIVGMEPFSAGATRTVAGVPADRQAAGDFHFVTASAGQAGVEEPTHQRSATHIFRTLGNRTFNLGPAMSAVTATTVATQPYARIRLSYTIQPEYNTWFTGTLSQDDHDVTLQASAGYLAGATTVTLEVPDFSAVAGWNNDWGLRVGRQTFWSLVAQGWPAGSDPMPGTWVDNTIYLSAQRSGQITP